MGNTHVVKRSLEFDWSPPPCRSRRGDITGYSYRLVNLDRDDNNITGDTENIRVTIENLVPYTLYSFHVLARTAAGDGPYSQGLEVRTSEASKLISCNQRPFMNSWLQLWFRLQNKTKKHVQPCFSQIFSIALHVEPHTKRKLNNCFKQPNEGRIDGACSS